MRFRHYHAPEMTFVEAVTAAAKRTSDGWLIVGVSQVDGKLEIMATDLATSRIGPGGYDLLDPAVEKLLIPIDPE